jgi:hypothetical protein
MRRSTVLSLTPQLVFPGLPHPPPPHWAPPPPRPLAALFCRIFVVNKSEDKAWTNWWASNNVLDSIVHSPSIFISLVQFNKTFFISIFFVLSGFRTKAQNKESQIWLYSVRLLLYSYIIYIIIKLLIMENHHSRKWKRYSSFNCFFCFRFCLSGFRTEAQNKESQIWLYSVCRLL